VEVKEEVPVSDPAMLVLTETPVPPVSPYVVFDTPSDSYLMTHCLVCEASSYHHPLTKSEVADPSIMAKWDTNWPCEGDKQRGRYRNSVSID